MRRNVRRLNREIGYHSASLSNPTAVIPLSVPSTYQPRKLIDKKLPPIKQPDDVIHSSNDNNNNNSNNNYQTNNNSIMGRMSAAEMAVAAIVAPVTTALPRKTSMKQLNSDGTVKKKGIRKAVNLSGQHLLLYSTLLYSLYIESSSPIAACSILFSIVVTSLCIACLLVTSGLSFST